MSGKRRGIAAGVAIGGLFMIAAVWFLLSMETLLLLPKGEPVATSISPGGDRCVNVYLCGGGATVDWSVRCEVKDRGLIDRNIYWQYHASRADVYWLDNDTVRINGTTLDVRRESYDYRKKAPGS